MFEACAGPRTHGIRSIDAGSMGDVLSLLGRGFPERDPMF